MGRDLDFCLDLFDYREYSAGEIMDTCRISPVVLEQSDALKRLRLVDEKLTPCFFVEEISAFRETSIVHNHRFTLGVICEGECVLEADNQRVELRRGDSFAMAAAADTYRIMPGKSAGAVRMCIVYPGADMES